MKSVNPPPPVSKPMLWTGRILSALPVLFMVGGGIYSLLNPAAIAKQLNGQLGYPEHLARTIAYLEIACALIYALPQTTVLGAILLTAYLGGATASHVRIGEPFFIPIIVGVVVWLGVFLRD